MRLHSLGFRWLLLWPPLGRLAAFAVIYGSISACSRRSPKSPPVSKPDWATSISFARFFFLFLFPFRLVLPREEFCCIQVGTRTAVDKRPSRILRATRTMAQIGSLEPLPPPETCTPVSRFILFEHLLARPHCSNQFLAFISAPNFSLLSHHLIRTHASQPI